MSTTTFENRASAWKTFDDAEDDATLPETNQLGEEFLAVVAHELRSPLAAIDNALLVLRQRGHETNIREWVGGLLERQTQQMDRLISDLLDVSRIRKGKLTICTQAVVLSQIVTRAVEAVRSIIEIRGHVLDIALPLEPMNLEADPFRFEQIVANLIGNAAKYTDPGGQIWLSVECEDDDIILQVRDTGIGIRADILPHIFDPFYQSLFGADHCQGGLGIGLALVRQLVELHGGCVSAFSDGLGQGSRFTVRLPRWRRARA